MEWKQAQYGCSETLSLCDGFITICCYMKIGRKGVDDPKPYAYTVNGNKGKTEFAKMDDCKRWALDQARIRWTKAGNETGWLAKQGGL